MWRKQRRGRMARGHSRCLAARAHEFFYDAILKRMEGDHHQPPAWFQQLLCSRKRRLKLGQLLIHLDTQRLKGKTIEDVRKQQREFQLGILDMQIEQENQISPDVLVFLDRAIPDARAYYRFLNLPEDEKLTEALRTVSYKKIFILDLVIFS